MFCTRCGKKLNDDMNFCTNCGKAVHSTAKSNTGANQTETFRSKKDNSSNYSFSSAKATGMGLLKQAYNFAQDGIQNAVANNETQGNILKVMDEYVEGLEETTIVDLLDILAQTSYEKILPPFFENMEANEIFFREKYDEVLFHVIYEQILKDLFVRIRAVDGFGQYWNIGNRARRAKKLSTEFFLRIVQKNYSVVKEKIHMDGDDELDVVLAVGEDQFYSPQIMFFVAALKKRPSAIQNYMEHYEELTIQNVTTARLICIKDAAMEEYKPDKGTTFQFVFLKDQPEIPIKMWRSNGKLISVQQICPRIQKRAELDELSEFLLDMDYIKYYKEDGEYHRDVAVHTNMFDSVESETVITDTRYVQIVYMDNQITNLTYSSFEPLKLLVPEKEYDVVKSIMKDKLAASEISNSLKDENNSLSEMTKRLKQLKELYDQELLTQEEYEAKKKDILNEI